jgi:hypothetical protein
MWISRKAAKTQRWFSGKVAKVFLAALRLGERFLVLLAALALDFGARFDHLWPAKSVFPEIPILPLPKLSNGCFNHHEIIHFCYAQAIFTGNRLSANRLGPS